MSRKLSLLFFVCLAVVLVKSESSIEVDENGDEYDVKKFNIQGRQLNGGRSQCVVTRRKRSTPTANKPEETEAVSNEDGTDESDDDSNMEQGQAMLFYQPPVMNYGGDADDDEEDYEDNEDNVNMNLNVNIKQGSSNDMNGNNEDEENMDNEDDDYDEEDDNVEVGGAETIEVVQLPQLPILGQLQSEGQSVAAIASSASVAGGHSGVYGNSGHVSVSQMSNNGYGNIGGHVSVSQVDGDSNGIMVVQSHAPPKVNPQTHAVFELVPVSESEADSDNDEEDGDEDDDHSDADDNLEFKEELSPITTTAIWSTGDDNTNDLYDDLDAKPPKPTKVVKKKPVANPVKVNRKTTKRPLRPIRKNKRKNNNKNKKITGNKNRPLNNKRRPNKNGNRNRRPVNKRKNDVLYKGSRPRRRRPTNLAPQRLIKKTRPVAQRVQQSNDNKDDKKTETKKKHRHSNSDNKDIAKKRKNKNNLLNIDQGTNTYTRTMTMTQTGDAEEEPEVNCIFIRKDPPPATTTARPFWNILGRSANGSPAASGPYGRRKRVNFRVVA